MRGWIYTPSDRRILTSARGSEASHWAADGRALERSDSSSATPSAKSSLSSECERETSTTVRSGTISETSPASFTAEEWISLLPVCRVSPSPSPENEKARPTSVTSGRTREGSSARWDPDSCSWRTFQVSLALAEDEPSAGSSESLPTSGMTRNGNCYRRQPLAPRTSVTGSGSLPTPDARDANAEGFTAGLARIEKYSTCGLQTALKLLPTPTAINPNEAEDLELWQERHERVKAEKKNGNGFGTPLGIAVRLLPTPTVPNGGRQPKGQMSMTGLTEEGEKRQVDLQWALRQLPTPHANCGNGAGSNGREGGLNLQTAAATLPTPTARMWKGASKTQVQRILSGEEADACRQELSVALMDAQGALPGTSSPATALSSSGLLNPSFVEWMMGFPIDWTALSPGERGRISRRSSRRVSLFVARVFRVLGTRSFRKWWPGSPGASSGACGRIDP